MPLVTALSDFMPKLDPAANSTRGFFNRKRRPFLSGYMIHASTVGAAKLVGVNDPGDLNNSTCVFVQGGGAADNATPVVYTLPAGTGVTLPTSADVSTAAIYANAIAIIYQRNNRANATLLPRVATGGANPTVVGVGFWRVETASTVTISTNYAAGPLYSDIPAGSIVEIIVPVATEVVQLLSVAAASDNPVQARDFMFAETSLVTLDRLAC